MYYVLVCHGPAVWTPDGGNFKLLRAMKRLIFLASVAALSLVSGAAASSTVFSPTSTETCMRAAGARVDRAPGIVPETFPEIESALYWHVSNAQTITIMFTPNANEAVELARYLKRTEYSVGLTQAQLKSTVGRLGNAVWTNNGFPGPTLEQDALIARCLRQRLGSPAGCSGCRQAPSETPKPVPLWSHDFVHGVKQTARIRVVLLVDRCALPRSVPVVRLDLESTDVAAGNVA